MDGLLDCTSTWSMGKMSIANIDKSVEHTAPLFLHVARSNPSLNKPSDPCMPELSTVDGHGRCVKILVNQRRTPFVFLVR